MNQLPSWVPELHSKPTSFLKMFISLSIVESEQPLALKGEGIPTLNGTITKYHQYIPVLLDTHYIALCLIMLFELEMENTLHFDIFHPLAYDRFEQGFYQ